MRTGPGTRQANRRFPFTRASIRACRRCPTPPASPPPAPPAGSSARSPAASSSARSASSAASAPPSVSSRSASASSTCRISSGFWVSGGGPAGGSARTAASSRAAAAAPPPNSRPGMLVGDRRHDRARRRVDHVDLAAQAGALERQPVARQPQVAELRGELGERGRLGLVAQPRLVQRDLRAGVGQRRVGIGRDQQERLRPEPARADAGDVGQQLVAAEAERADDARRQRVARRDVRADEAHRDSVVEQAADDAADQPPPPARWELPPAPSATGGWK